MTETKRDDLYNYGKSPLSPYQQAREKALQSAAAVLSASSGFMIAQTKNPPKSIDDLLRTADWILGSDRPELPPAFASPFDLQGVGVKIDPENLPALFEALGRISEDCGHPDCPIHAPTREAQDLKPEDAVSSFDDPVDFDNMEQTGMAEASDFEGGEADAGYPPRSSANDYPIGHRLYHQGHPWKVAERPDGGKKWERELSVADWREIKDAGLPDPQVRRVGERFVVGEKVWQVTSDGGSNYWVRLDANVPTSDDDEETPEF